MVERLLLREHRLQVGRLAVDLVLHGEQVADAAGVLQQRPQLGDGRLVGRDQAAHVGDLLGHVLRLLLQGKLGAEPGAGQPAQRRRVDRGRDLERDGRGRARGGLARPLADAVLGRDVAAGRGHDRRRRRQRGAHVLRPDGELGGVDQLHVAGRVAGGGGLRLAALIAAHAARAGAAGAENALLADELPAALAAALAAGMAAPLAATAPDPALAGAEIGLLLLAPLEQPASADSVARVAMVMTASPAARGAGRECAFSMPLGRGRGNARLRA